MSGKRSQESWKFLGIPWEARFLLLGFTVTFLGNPSCLLSTTTQFPVAVESPPYVNTNTAIARPLGRASVPMTSLIRVDNETEEVTLSVDVQSDDAGRTLRSRAFINYNLDANEEGGFLEVFGGEDIPPGTFDEVRNIGASFSTEKLEDGCYQVALVITHEFDGIRRIPVNAADTAFVVWWMVKGDPASIDFSQCPGVPASADLDAGDEEN